MVAYSFQAQFAPQILAGTKRQTIRAVGRRRHARPGEALQLYVGMRTKFCRRIAVAQCTRFLPVAMKFAPLALVFVAGRLCPSLEDFAREDGFTSWAELRSFWREHHAGVESFEGVLIGWGDLL